MISQFHITASARQVLGNWMKSEELSEHVPTIAWTGDAKGKNWEWSVGTHIRNEVPASTLVMIADIEFAIDPALHSRLEGKTLDHVNGYFFVRD